MFWNGKEIAAHQCTPHAAHPASHTVVYLQTQSVLRCPPACIPQQVVSVFLVGFFITIKSDLKWKGYWKPSSILVLLQTSFLGKRRALSGVWSFLKQSESTCAFLFPFKLKLIGEYRRLIKNRSREIHTAENRVTHLTGVKTSFFWCDSSPDCLGIFTGEPCLNRLEPRYRGRWEELSILTKKTFCQPLCQGWQAEELRSLHLSPASKLRQHELGSSARGLKIKPAVPATWVHKFLSGLGS